MADTTKKAARAGNPKRILLGYGLFYIDDIFVGLTRGGGQFTVEREYRKITADGDRGGYKGRITHEGSVPKLKINLLEVINNIERSYPAVKEETEAVTNSETNQIASITKVRGLWSIDEETDYHTVKWVGKTKNGKEAVIKVENAINLDNIDFSLVEKDEVVPAVTFEGTYTDDCAEDYEPWEVTWINEETTN